MAPRDLARDESGLPLREIEGKYEILEKMREGGMGALYKVRHRLLDEVRVIKMMRPHLASDPTLRARFLREAKVAIRLRHANLAELYDFAMDDEGYAFIVMEYIEGLTLIDLTKTHGIPSLELAIEISTQALDVLGFLHRKHVVHRDISPDNLILTRDEDGQPLVKLIDLGIAKLTKGDENLTAIGTFLGKVRYSSPEHFTAREGADVDCRSDLYSLGIVIYELLTGTYPIPGRSTTSLIAAHLNEPPISFDVTDPSKRVPDGLRRAVLRALAKSPSDRFADAARFHEAIKPFRGANAIDQAEVNGIFKAPAQTTRRIPVVRPGSTQDHLDRGLALMDGQAGEQPAPVAATQTPPAPPDQQDVQAGGEERSPTPSPARVDQQIKALLLGAAKLVELKHLDEARLQLSTVLELDPDNHEARRLEVAINAADQRQLRRRQDAADDIKAMVRDGRLEDAEARLEAAIKSFGDAAELVGAIELINKTHEARAGLGEELSRLEAQAADAMTEERFEDAIGLLDRAVGISGSNELRGTELEGRQPGLEAWRDEAAEARQSQLEEERRAQEIEQTARAIEVHIEAQKADEARRALTVAEKLYGTGEPFLSLRRGLDRLVESLAQAEAAAHGERAAKLMSEQRYQEAVDELQLALEIAPQHSKTMRALAAAKKALAEQQEAARYQQHLQNLLKGIERLIATGRLDSAERRLVQLEADDPQVSTAETREALVAAREELRERQSRAFALLERARQHAEQHAFSEARDQLDRARAFAAELADVHQLVTETAELIDRTEKEHRRAAEVERVATSISAHLEADQLDKAEHELEVARRLYGDQEALEELQAQLDTARQQERNARIEHLMREALTQQSSFDQVIATLERALALDPENETVQRLLAESRAALHRYEQEQRLQQIATAMQEIDELILAGDLEAASQRLETAVSEIGDFKDARLVRFRLAAMLG